MNSVFSSYHPIINFGFFCAVIGISIFMQHPIFVLIGIAVAATYAVMLGGKVAVRLSLYLVLPVIIVFMAVNLFTNHRGETVLFMFGSRAYTLEAAVFGCVSGLILGAVLLWFSCFSRIMTSDKFVYLFGRILPAISLILSMVMRFIPNFRMQIQKISNSQKCIGVDVTDGTNKEKIRHGVKILSIMMTWALESAIDTADSMRSRGYGLKDRTAFSVYRFDGRDVAALVFLIITTGIVVVGAVMGKCAVEFYPTIVMSNFDALMAISIAAYIGLCFFPIVVELKEAVVWKLSQSKI